ncbi:MAG: M23 family metallopeptidase [Erysipelotrichaceae bacterium]|nr:M23 family metallopeptidase [Erysipelotrichaceae bacterium]
MNQRKQIRKKVAQLRKEENRNTSSIVNSIYTLVLLLMCCAVVVLAERIYQAGGFEPVIAQISQWSDTFNLTHLREWLFLEKWMNNQTLAVSSTTYQLIEGQYYEADSNEVISLDDGIVIYCDEQSSGQVVMIHQDNGLIVTYGLLNEVFCKEDDRILKGTLIGKVENEVYLDFSFQGVSISYEEAISFEP